MLMLELMLQLQLLLLVDSAVQSDGLSIVRSGGEDALMGAFNDAPKCSTATTSLVSVSLLGSAGDPVAGQSAQIQVSTPSSIVNGSNIRLEL